MFQFSGPRGFGRGVVAAMDEEDFPPSTYLLREHCGSKRGILVVVKNSKGALGEVGAPLELYYKRAETRGTRFRNGIAQLLRLTWGANF